jgi:hypothetical protein
MRIVVAEAQGQFGNSEERKRPPLETVTRELVNSLVTEKSKFVL